MLSWKYLVHTHTAFRFKVSLLLHKFLVHLFCIVFSLSFYSIMPPILFAWRFSLLWLFQLLQKAFWYLFFPIFAFFDHFVISVHNVSQKQIRFLKLFLHFVILWDFFASIHQSAHIKRWIIYIGHIDLLPKISSWGVLLCCLYEI